MSKKSDRRAAEREARRAAYLRQHRAAEASHPEPAAEPVPQMTPETEQTTSNQISEAQLAANRANAQQSTGPTTPAGRARSSMNALKNGLTGKTVVLPSESLDTYNRHLEIYIEKYRPVTDEEMRLVRNINDCIWRISRVQQIEISLNYKADLEFAEKFEDRNEADRFHLSNAAAYLKYEKQLRNLCLQEARLRRYIEKDTAELARLQNFRRREEVIAAQLAAQKPSQPNDAPTHQPQPNGFDFSTSQNQRTTTAQPAPKHQQQAA